MNEPKRPLKINISDLELAFDHHNGMSFFLDLETGEVAMVTDEELGLLEDIYETYLNEEVRKVDWPNVLPLLDDIPDWQKESLQKAEQVEAGVGTRYISIPEAEPYDGYNEMVDFIETVSNLRLQSQLEQAIHGKGAFRRFKDVLLDHPQEREQWFQFSDQRARERVADWLESIGIEPIE